MLHLRYKAVKASPVHVGDLVQTYIGQPKEKRGKWSDAKPVLRYDPYATTVTVAGARSQHTRAAAEYVRAAVSRNEFSVAIRESIDALDQSLSAATEDVADDANEVRSAENHNSIKIDDLVSDSLLEYYRTDSNSDLNTEKAWSSTNHTSNTDDPSNPRLYVPSFSAPSPS